MAITSLPTPPSRSDPANFPERADAFMAALPQFADEANVLQTEVNQAAVAVDNDATAAAASSSYAANRAASAAASASSATDAQQAATQKAADAGASASWAERWATKLGGPVSGDGFSAQHYAQIAALGAGLPVVFAGSIPTSNIGPVYISGQGPAEWYGATNAYRVISEIPVGKVEWCSLRAAIWPGYVPGDGQTLSRATYPDITEMVIAGRVPVVSEADWLADPLKRGAYTLGDGSTTIRIPDYNGKSAGSVGRVFPSGDGVNSAGVAGVIQRDALQNIKGSMIAAYGAAGSGTGALASSPDANGGAPAYPNLLQTNYITFDASRVARTSTTTYPVNVTGCFVIKAFGVVVNPGSADAAQLATDYAALNAAFQTLNGQLDFTIIYPNGGTAAAPANIAVNSRYVTANPYPGFRVFCQVEIRLGGVWGTPGGNITVPSTGEFCGVLSAQYNDDAIVTQTALNYLLTNTPSASLHPFPGPGVVTSAPARIKVWKVKGAIA